MILAVFNTEAIVNEFKHCQDLYNASGILLSFFSFLVVQFYTYADTILGVTISIAMSLL